MADHVISWKFGDKPYRQLENLHDDLLRLIHEHDGVSLAEVLGVLRLLENTLILEHQ